MELLDVVIASQVSISMYDSVSYLVHTEFVFCDIACTLLYVPERFDMWRSILARCLRGVRAFTMIPGLNRVPSFLTWGYSGTPAHELFSIRTTVIHRHDMIPQRRYV